jgi:ferredoxin
MAERINQVPENVPGKYYVDTQCIVCGVCPDVAPNNFKIDGKNEHAYVYKQPENESEEADCVTAAESCPVNAIGFDD